MTRLIPVLFLATTLPLATNGFSSIRQVNRPNKYKGRAICPRLPRLSVVRSESLHQDERRDGHAYHHGSKQGRSWPRRVWSKILRTEASSSLHMTTATVQIAEADTSEEALMDLIGQENVDFIIKNFQDINPSLVLPVPEEIAKDEAAEAIDSEFFDVSITQAPADASAADTTIETSKSRGPTNNISIGGVMSRVTENILTSLIMRVAVDEPEDLQIAVQPRGHVFNRLIRGQFSTDAKIQVGRLVFRNIRMSSGILEIKRMTLNLLGFLSPSQTRFQNQFDLHADDLTFSRHDLLFSSCIRNGLRRLLVRILRDRGVQTSTIKVNHVDILVRIDATEGRDTGYNFRLFSFITHKDLSFFYSHSLRARFPVKEKQ
jgi:hypothetical protein